MKCINCYRKIDENLKFCNFCGAKQPVDREAYEREHPELANALPEEELLEQKQEHQRQIMELKLRQEELERQIRQVTEHLEQEQKTTVAQPNVAATIATTSSEDVKAITGQPNAAVNDSVERERSAMGNTGYNFPRKAVVINTSPSNPEKISDAQKQTERSKMPEVKVPIQASSNTSASAHKPIYQTEEYPVWKKVLWPLITLILGALLAAGACILFKDTFFPVEQTVIDDQRGNQSDVIIEEGESADPEDGIDEGYGEDIPRINRDDASRPEDVRQAIEQTDRGVEQARQTAAQANQQGARQNNQQAAAQQQQRQQQQAHQQRQQRQRQQQAQQGQQQQAQQQRQQQQQQQRQQQQKPQEQKQQKPQEQKQQKPQEQKQQKPQEGVHKKQVASSLGEGQP